MDFDALINEIRSFTSLVYVQTHDVEPWLAKLTEKLSRHRLIRYSDEKGWQLVNEVRVNATTWSLPPVITEPTTPFSARFAQSFTYDPKDTEAFFLTPGADRFFAEANFVPTVRQAVEARMTDPRKVFVHILFGTLDLPEAAKPLFRVIRDKGPTLGEIRDHVGKLSNLLGINITLDAEMFLGCSIFQVEDVITHAYVAERTAIKTHPEVIDPNIVALKLSGVTRAYGG